MGRTIETYPIVSGNSTGTLTSGTANVEITLPYGFPHDPKGAIAVKDTNAQAGEASLVIILTTASSTASCTISAKNLYYSGSSVDLAEESYWTVDTVTATTSGVTSMKLLHVANTANYDPNADGIRIRIARSESVNVTYKGRLVRA